MVRPRSTRMVRLDEELSELIDKWQMIFSESGISLTKRRISKMIAEELKEKKR